MQHEKKRVQTQKGASAKKARARKRHECEKGASAKKARARKRQLDPRFVRQNHDLFLSSTVCTKAVAFGGFGKEKKHAGVSFIGRQRTMTWLK